MVNIKRFKSTADTIKFLAEQFITTAVSSIQEKEIFRVGLSGGNSPKPFFSLMANQYTEALDWTKVEFYWIDERWVSIEDEESNYGNAYRIWLNKLPSKLFPMVKIVSNQEEQMRLYDQLLDAKFGNTYGLDWVLIGVGADGHIASIFPNDSTGVQSKQKVFLAYHPATLQPRISMTMRFLLHSKQLFYLITGKEKEHILNRLVTGTIERDDALPIEYLLRGSLNHLILTDIEGR